MSPGAAASREPLQQHAVIASLDPLEALAAMQRLPALNRARDVAALRQLLAELVRRASSLHPLQPSVAAAVMRDIGFLLGSLKRHGFEPVAQVPGLEPLLLRLARETDLPPRDTLLHLSVWNPAGSCMRTYTGLVDEVNLIASVRNAMPAVEAAIAKLVALHSVPVDAPDFVDLCGDLERHLENVVASIRAARSGVSPCIFARELRLYYEPIEVAGHTYLGPGAVEMPVFVVDHLLWSSRVESASYVKFKQTYLPYVLAPLRQVYATFTGKPSLLERALSGAAPVRSLTSLMRVFNSLVRFRAPHARLADQAYRAESGTLREVGSGGYSPAFLQEILDLTVKHRMLVRHALDKQSLLAC